MLERSEHGYTLSAVRLCCTFQARQARRVYTLLKPDEAEHYATLAWSR